MNFSFGKPPSPEMLDVKPECRDDLALRLAEYQHERDQRLSSGYFGVARWGIWALSAAILMVCYRIIMVPGDKADLANAIISVIALVGMLKEVIKECLMALTPSAVNQSPRRQADTAPTGTKNDPVATDATIVKDETQKKDEEKV